MIPKTRRRVPARSKSIALAAVACLLLLSAGCRQAPVETPETEEPGRAVIYPDGAQARRILPPPWPGRREKKTGAARLRGQLVGDCQVLEIYFHDPSNRGLLEANYVLVPVNIGRYDENLDIAAKYGVPVSKGVPALAVLAPDGQLVYSQRNAEFEAMRKMDSASVTAFLFASGRAGPSRALERFRLALMTSLSHDVFGAAKAAAYSAILCLFPTILVLTTLLALTPESDTLRGEMRAAFSEVLPADTMTLLHAYFTNQKVRSEQVVSSALLVSLAAAMGMMLSLMGGFRRAYDLPRHEWNFWVERGVALAMVPLCLVRLAFATVLVAFGHQIEQWVVSNSYHVLGPLVLVVWRIVRWSIGLFTTIVVLALIYQFGTPRRREWKHVLPGASGAAVHWFLATLGVLAFVSPVSRLLRGLRSAGSRGGYAGVALHLDRERADRRRVQRSYLSQAAAAAAPGCPGRGRKDGGGWGEASPGRTLNARANRLSRSTRRIEPAGSRHRLRRASARDE